MDFRVHTSSDVHDYSGSARYDLDHPGSGLLAVWPGDGTKVVYGPAGWHRLEEKGATPAASAAPQRPRPR